MSQKPFVSVICPTYNRRKFLPNLIYQFNYQTYPQDRMELLIIDDTPTSNEDIISQYKQEKQDNIRYIYLNEKIALAKKRTMLNKLAKGEILVCFDDDDWYSNERVHHVVHKLMSNPKVEIVGSTILHIYYIENGLIYQFGPYSPTHGTHGTFGYKKSYLKHNSYDDTLEKAEESKFTNNFTEPLIQLDPFKTMICISHGNNTVDKIPFIPQGKETKLKLKDFFKKNDKYMLNFITNLRKEYIEKQKNITI